MKKIVFLLALATVTLWTTARAQTEAEITYQDFYDGLAPYGDWVYVDGYGYCWQPGVEEGWRPYTNGGWIYTNAGWTWSSDEEWGWATDHYGRWMLTTEFGWLWVPGYEWAPAWVSWRKSDEYVGWAPLPPEATWQPASGFGPSVDVSFSIGPQYYNFCRVRHLGAPRLRPYIVSSRENVSIINNTVNVTKITNVNNVMIFNEGPDFAQIQRRTEQPIRWARLERRWDVNREVVRGGEVRNRFEGDVFRVVAPRVERSNREGRPLKVAATVRREEFDEKIGQERRRVRERTRDLDRSAEADIPPPPDGRDQRFDPRREDLGDVPADQRVTDGQGRRERGSREPESETLGNQQQSQDQTRGRDRQKRQERRDGPEDSSQTPPASDPPRLEADQPTPPGSQPSREERRRGRTGAQGQSQDREMQQDQEGPDTQRRQQRQKDQSEESRQGSPEQSRDAAGCSREELKAATVRHSGLRKMARRNAEQAKGRISSVGKTAAQTNLNNLSRELLLHRQAIANAAGRSARELQGGDSQAQRPPKDGQKERGASQGTDKQRGQGRGSDQSESPQAAPPAQPPPPDGPGGSQAAREQSQRGGGEQNSAEKSRESRGDSERPAGQRKQAEAPKTPPENVQQRRPSGENTRQEQKSSPPAERRESNAQQQRQGGDQKAQGEKSGPPQGQQQKSRGDGQKGKGKKSDSKGEGEGNKQSGEGEGQEGRGE